MVGPSLDDTACLESQSLVMVVAGPQNIRQNDVDDFLRPLFDELRMVDGELSSFDLLDL